MKERPILFSAPMVRAILAGTKTQTRRVMKPQPLSVDGGVPFGNAPKWAHAEPGSAVMRCPYGKRGDRLWVRETWAYGIHALASSHDEDGPFCYAATDSKMSRLCTKWRPSIHMPRHASRIKLEVTSVHVERLQDISEADALAEGVNSLPAETRLLTPRLDYVALWNAINGPGSWEANPWVWVVEFTRAEGATK
jgi:hypothetical protein